MTNGMREGISREIAKALERAAVRGREAPSEEILPIYDRIQESFLPMLSGNFPLILELRRRVAEWKLLLLSERNRSREEVVPLFEAVRELGFSTPEREATITIGYAKYLLRTGEPEEAKALLEKLAHQLDQIIEAEDVKVYRELRQHVTLLLQSQA